MAVGVGWDNGSEVGETKLNYHRGVFVLYVRRDCEAAAQRSRVEAKQREKKTGIELSDLKVGLG